MAPAQVGGSWSSASTPAPAAAASPAAAAAPAASPGEDAAKLAWLAKLESAGWGGQGAPAASGAAEVSLPMEESSKAAWLAKQDVPSWGAKVGAVLAEVCEQGVEEACEALTREEEAKANWLALRSEAKRRRALGLPASIGGIWGF